MDIQTVSQRFRSVRYFVREIFEGNVLLQIYKVLYAYAMFCVPHGGRRLKKKHLSSSFAIESLIRRLLRAHKHLHEYLFSYKDCSDCEISADKYSHFF